MPRSDHAIQDLESRRAAWSFEVENGFQHSACASRCVLDARYYKGHVRYLTRQAKSRSDVRNGGILSGVDKSAPDSTGAFWRARSSKGAESLDSSVPIRLRSMHLYRFANGMRFALGISQASNAWDERQAGGYRQATAEGGESESADKLCISLPPRSGTLSTILSNSVGASFLFRRLPTQMQRRANAGS